MVGKRTKEKTAFWRLGNPIMWASVATGAFIALIFWLGMADTCNIDLFPKGDCPPKWQHLRAAPFNEVGDTLAGIAGVLAFIWLISTVLLQSIELGEQRKELSEARKAQEKQVEALDAQADIFRDEQEFRREQKAALVLQDNCRLLIDLVNYYGRWFKVELEGSPPAGIPDSAVVVDKVNSYKVVFFNPSYKGEDVADTMQKISWDLYLSTHYLERILAGGAKTLTGSINKARMVEILAQVENVHEMQRNFVDGNNAQFLRLRTTRILADARKLLDLNVWSDVEFDDGI